MTDTPQSQPNNLINTNDDAGNGAAGHGPFNLSEQEIYERLHRLRRDVPSSAILPEPPHIPALAGRLTLRTADPTAEDPETVSQWMNRPHLIETWEQPWPPDRWKRDWEAKLTGTYSVPLIMLLDGEECGYMEIYRPHRDEIGRVYDSQPHALGFHVAGGDAAKIGHGFFPPLLINLCD
ncbi:N-acetyltransferase, partial [Klebsiella pneumoniae]|uniref:GNAT family N-acetyltransferase n=1 Tax=Klebsiella pneumoniae TaxID=573 RepID=UPI0010AAAB5C